MNRFEKIVLLGSKTTAYKCAQIFARKAKNIYFYENIVNAEKIPSCYYSSSVITWYICNNHQWKYLLRQEKEKTLLISIMNNYIIPSDILANDKITFINLHSGLLPSYRGRNCGGWALFNEEEITGVSWHYLTDKVDDGNLLWQKKIPITDSDTSLGILRKQNESGLKIIDENLDKILCEDIHGIPQPIDKKINYYYAKDKPNDGYFDFNWSGKKISCFLRAMDYGPLYEFGVPMIDLNSKKYFITAYKIEKSNSECKLESVQLIDDMLLMEKDNYRFKLTIKQRS